MKEKTLREKFMHLDMMRSDLIDKAYEQALFTIPSLFPDRYYQGKYDVRDLPELYSSKAGNNSYSLATLVTDSIFPPNDTPFFEFRVTDVVAEENKEAVLNALQQAERYVLRVLQTSNLREKTHKAVLYSIVMLDALIKQTDKDKFKLYHPAHFLVRRNGEGEIREYWTVDWVVTELLNDDLKNLNNGKPKWQVDDCEPLYTYIYKSNDSDDWKVEREFRDTKYETDKTYEVLPYYYFGWSSVDGEDHSRSLVELNMGTIRSLEMVCKALAEGLAAGSEGRILIDPASTTTEDDILGTTNWSFISARPGSVDTWQPNTIQSVGTALQAKAVYEQELDEAFLSTSASDLRGDRVTAYQVNRVDVEKSRGLGGALTLYEYSYKQIVYRTLYMLIDEEIISQDLRDLIDEGAVEIVVSSGIDAMSRQMDTLRIESILNVAASTQDPEMLEVLNKPNMMRALVRNSGLDMEQFTYTQQQVDERRAAAQQSQIQQQAAEQTIKSVGNIAEGNLTG